MEELFVAAEQELHGALESGPSTEDQMVLDLGALFIASGLLTDGAEADFEPETVATAGEEGPCIFRVPDRLTGRLAALTDEEADRLARAWGEATARDRASLSEGEVPRIGPGVLGWLLVAVLRVMTFFEWLRHPRSGWPASGNDEPEQPRPEQEGRRLLDVALRLRELARKADDPGRGLYLWTAL